MDAWRSYPFMAALGFLFVVAMLRGQATYWLARAVTEQALRRTNPVTGWRAAVHRWLTGDALDRGRGIVQRWGVAAVPLCYLTVGVQTVVLASAGVIRMPWPRFTLAQSLGALAWAAIYSTVGFAVWAGLARAAVTGGPWPAVGLVLLVVVLTGVTWRRYRSDPLSRPPSARPSPPRPR